MKEASQHLIETIERAQPLLRTMKDAQASAKPNPNKWSAKEIIGHLIDSANNNQQKFVRSMATDDLHFVGYEQDWWVSCQHYNEEAWEQLLNTWANCNYHLAHVMQYIPASTLQNKIYINDMGPYTLEFIVNDYTEHLKHHLKELLPNEQFLTNKFKMVY